MIEKTTRTKSFLKKSAFSLLIALFTIGLSSFIIKKQDKITIWMIGDSTMSIKAKDKYPETGWGVPFPNMYQENIQVVNKARNGRSTKSFIKEGSWEEVYSGMQKGDYIFIQFGHNDEKVQKPTTGTQIPEYKGNLSDFVEGARIKGANPILLTPIVRRVFEDGELIKTHGEYPEAVRVVADSLNVPLIDLTKITRELLLELGEEGSKKLFLHLPEGHKNYPKGVTDNTHLNEYGAQVITDLVVEELIRQNIPLKNSLKTN